MRAKKGGGGEIETINRRKEECNARGEARNWPGEIVSESDKEKKTDMWLGRPKRGSRKGSEEVGGETHIAGLEDPK